MFSIRPASALYILVSLSLLLSVLFMRWYNQGRNRPDTKHLLPTPATSPSIEKLQPNILPEYPHVPLVSAVAVTGASCPGFHPPLPSACAVAGVVSSLSERSDISSQGMWKAQLSGPVAPMSPPLPVGFGCTEATGSETPVQVPAVPEWQTWQTVHGSDEDSGVDSNSFSPLGMEPCGKDPSLPPRIQRETVYIFRGVGLDRRQTWRRRILEYG